MPTLLETFLFWPPFLTHGSHGSHGPTPQKKAVGDWSLGNIIDLNGGCSRKPWLEYIFSKMVIMKYQGIIKSGFHQIWLSNMFFLINTSYFIAFCFCFKGMNIHKSFCLFDVNYRGTVGFVRLSHCHMYIIPFARVTSVHYTYIVIALNSYNWLKQWCITVSDRGFHKWGPPKSSIWIGFSTTNNPFLKYPIYESPP